MNNTGQASFVTDSAGFFQFHSLPLDKRKGVTNLLRPVL
jgi:hypothetical protein